MNSIIGVICDIEAGNYKRVTPQPIGSTTITLDDNVVWDVGIDQSTSCTGITILGVNKPLLGVFDLHRDKAISDAVYFSDLKNFLIRTLGNKKVRFIVHEKPVPNRKFQNAQRVLQELKGRITEWLLEIPGLSNTRIDSLFPQTWKQYVVNPSKGKGRTKDKRAIAADICDIVPVLSDYFRNYPYSTYDGFDSFGIIFGFRQYAFNSAGIERIHGTAEKRHIAVACYFESDLPFRQAFAEVFGEYSTLTVWKSAKFLAYNEEHDLVSNIRMASTNSYPVLTLLPKNTECTQYLKWKFGIENTKKFTYCFMLRRSVMTPNEYALLKKLVSANEEIFGE